MQRNIARKGQSDSRKAYLKLRKQRDSLVLALLGLIVKLHDFDDPSIDRARNALIDVAESGL